MFKRTLVILAIAMALSFVSVANATSPPPSTVDSLLNAEDSARFDALPADVQSIVTDNFLPAMRNAQFTTEAQSSFLSHVVETMYGVYVLNPPLQVNGMDTLPGGKCYPSGPFFWYNESNVSAYSGVTCDYQQDSVTSETTIAPHGFNVTGVANHRLHATNSWSLVVRIYQSDTYWHTCAHFATTPDSDPQRALAKPPRGKNCINDWYTP